MTHSKNQTLIVFYLKLIILLFWSAWFFIVFLTNITDFLVSTGMINRIAFRSGNYHLLESVLSIYQLPSYVLNLLFSLDIITQGTSALLFFSAAICFWRSKHYSTLALLAFMISISLWMIFVLMEEIFIAYAYEAVHLRLIMVELLSLFTFYLLPL